MKNSPTRLDTRQAGHLMLRWMALLIPLSLLLGCGTINSYASGCPGIYSGVHYDRDLLSVYRNDLATGAPEARLRNVWDPWVVSLDLPLSAMADVVTLPMGWALRSHPTPAGHMGCPRDDHARPWQALWKEAAI
jgi:uncharacterized protein YceK